MLELQQKINPRNIAKEMDSNGRSDLAKIILETRTQIRESRKQEEKREQLLAELSKLVSISYGEEHRKENELTIRTEEIIVKLKRIVGIGDARISKLNTDIAKIKSERNTLRKQICRIEDELKRLKVDITDIPSPQDLLDAYYEKISNTPLTNEQKRQLLHHEAIAQLNLEQYIALWKRLNPSFLTHVTRQGFRDHNAMTDHSAGVQEFHSGFLGIMTDEKLLRPSMALSPLKNRDETSVREWLGNWVFEVDERQAYDRLDKLMNPHLALDSKYPDKTAVHFATQLVADQYYGGESNNEIFIVYPSDIIASQLYFAFNSLKKDFTKPQSETKWNDVFVWPSTVNNAGIPIDAGIVFLPKSQPVDSETGSKYASLVVENQGQKQRVMVEDGELVQKFLVWGNSLEDGVIEKFNRYQSEKSYSRKQELAVEVVKFIYQKIISLGFSIDAALDIANKLFKELHWKTSFENEQLEKIIKNCGAHYKRAENPITAQEYWEQYFIQHPEYKPRHIVYYDGDPTSAIIVFQRQNGIGKADTSDIDGPLLGFDDQHVDDISSDPRANAGKDELIQMAKTIISEHYSSS